MNRLTQTVLPVGSSIPREFTEPGILSLKVNIMPKIVNLAYAAGIIDGEGHITIQKYNNPACRVGFHYGLCITVGMGDPTVPKWLHKTFGGSFGIYPPGKRGKKNRHIWRLTTRKADMFLKLILPYLKEKVEQARIAIKFQAGKQANYCKTNPRPIALIEADAILAQRIRDLHNKI